VAQTCLTYCEYNIVETFGQMAADPEARVGLTRSLDLSVTLISRYFECMKLP
jgi:hypothetical protein